ncbi:MAG: ArsA-related P-loop ATPase [Sandaracinus sp.]
MTSKTPAAASLAEIVRGHRVVVCVGSGGVGKTTTAAALALHAAMHGRRVLCLTIDPAKRLANSLGLAAMTEQEQAVPAELFAKQGLTLTGSLSAMMLDTKRTFDELVRTTASSRERADRILGNRLYQYISTSLAGTQEYMAMEKLHAVRRDPRYDLVVLDTPPTSNALDFLDAPERLAGLVDSPAMRWLTQTVQGEKRSFSLSLLTKGAKVVLAGLSKFTGAGFIEQVAHFVSDFNDLFGGFRKRAEEVASTLRSEEVAFVIVTSPAPLSVDEAIFFSERLRESGMPRDAFVVNQVHPLVAEPSEPTSALEAEATKTMTPGADAPRLVGRMRRALDDARLQAVADRLECDRLETHGGQDVLYVEVPVLDQDVHDLDALAEIASYLVGERKHAAVTR